LGFAWNVPVSMIKVNGTESKDKLVGLITDMADKAKTGEWVKASYGGEPNITKPKNRI